MSKYVLVGLLVFVLFCAALAPASLLSIPLAQLGGPSLTQASGTVWNGVGDLHWGSVDLGTVEWYFDWAGVPAGTAAFHLRLYDENTHLHGRVAAGWRRTTLAAEGSFDAGMLNPWLVTHGLHLSGWMQLDLVTVAFANNQLENADGDIQWSGGPVYYRSGGTKRSAALPPLLARVQSATVGAAVPSVLARVVTEDGEWPLIEVEAIDGWLKIGVTKRLLQLVDAPWPGQAADDELVITLEEQLF